MLRKFLLKKAYEYDIKQEERLALLYKDHKNKSNFSNPEGFWKIIFVHLNGMHKNEINLNDIKRIIH
ncbi:hypothetical protein RCL_jg6397.t1 [Rhizophagus clarus]|uniref:Uncharacterized protein n=1 Tax=Rhizophagus clarus TaxID=94130 RepID=A0A8H3QHM5_9GLOM|nr:hypothetical protein RCL_jg6397.t1 [Rhizophagus clarus]